MTAPTARQIVNDYPPELVAVYPYVQCRSCRRAFVVGPISRRYKPIRCSQCKGDHIASVISQRKRRAA